MFIYIIIIGVLIVGFIYIYNRLVRLRNAIREAASGVEVQLKRRYDLVPNLITTIKGYAGHEKGLFEKVAEVRATCINTQGLSNKVELENQLAFGIDKLIAVAENYPELKAGENFLKLQKDLFELEDSIQYARRYYNAVVRDFNNTVETFPGLLVAKLFNFKREAFFELKEAAEREVVAAKF
ncbi:MAG: hypothetical protein A2231_12400 [Candidatus Firestonebacteria bacterium RIFOXYA2_FULL_40_8]|nr:MAG: hypothetical protein A2231_12400 [Candidatus Firestonebacteria bacterium RIFOXYA2_FULL_40_8]